MKKKSDKMIDMYVFCFRFLQYRLKRRICVKNKTI